MDRIMNTFRDKQDQRMVLVVWSPDRQEFELYWIHAKHLPAFKPAAPIRTFKVPGEFGMTEWNKHKAMAVTFARGLASMNDAQFDRALIEMTGKVPA